MTTSTTTRTGRAGLLAVTTGVVLSSAMALTGGTAQAAPLAPPAADASATGAAAASAYEGDAFGTSVDLGSVVKSGKSAPVVLGCTTKAGISRTGSTAGLNVPLLARSGTVSTTATTSASPTRSRTTARTEGVNLLTGLVTADVVEAASSTTRSGGSFETSAAGSTFLNLKIAGKGVPASPAANTRLELPGLGYVVLNEQVKTGTAKSASLAVNALHLVVTQKNLGGVAVGSNIIISHARTGLSAPVQGVLGGFAYGSKLTVGTLVKSGPSFQRVLPCLGTDGVPRTTTGANVLLPAAVGVGAVRDLAKGTVDETVARGTTSSTIEGTNLLNGLVKATVIKAVANGSESDAGARTFDDAGSTFGTLSVQGFPQINASVAPNTELAIPGVGTLYLHRVIRTGNRVEVRMVELVLSSASHGLPVGADLRVGVAAVSVD